MPHAYQHLTLLLAILLLGLSSPSISTNAYAQETEDDTPEVAKVPPVTDKKTKDEENADNAKAEKKATKLSDKQNTKDAKIKQTPSNGEIATATSALTIKTAQNTIVISVDENTKDDNERNLINVTPQNASQGSAPAQKIDYWHTDGLNAYFQLSSEGYLYDNLDFRPIAAPTAPFVDILNSDDRSLYASTWIAAGINYTPIDEIKAAISVSHTGNWGSRNSGSAGVSVERFFVQWKIWSNDIVAISTTVGRQKFALGSYLSGSDLQNLRPRDFILSDIVDGITFDLDFNKYGKLRLLPIDLYAVGGRPKENHVAAPNIQTHYSSKFNFNGKTSTIRMGGIYENTKLVEDLAFRIFFLYANIGANGSGADRSASGTSGNAVDEDYTWMAGARLNYTWHVNDLFTLGVGAEYAHSGGIDRKPVQSGYLDVNTKGNAYGASAIASFHLGSMEVAFPLQFFRADGNHYNKNGLLDSHGFTSFKGQSVGGLLLSGELGWRPSAYISNGIVDSPNSKGRKAGTMVLSGGVSATFFDKLLEATLTTWYLVDTSHTDFPVNDEAAVTAASSNTPFGWTREEIEAERRYGKSLATEINLGLTYNPFKILSIYAVGGILIPGEFYKIEIDQKVGDFIGSKNPTNGWGVSLGMTLSL